MQDHGNYYLATTNATLCVCIRRNLRCDDANTAKDAFTDNTYNFKCRIVYKVILLSFFISQSCLSPELRNLWSSNPPSLPSMCGFLRIVFSCQHHLNTHALQLCHSPLRCLETENLRYGSNVLEKLDLSLLPDHLFALRSISDQACASCSIESAPMAVETRTREQENATTTMAESQTKADRLVQIQLQQLAIDQRVEAMLRQAFEVRAHYQRKYPHSRVPPRAHPRRHVLCASGDCSNQAVVHVDGRRGEFCRKHTCAARDWGCLDDVYPLTLNGTDRRGDDGPRYCRQHTCRYSGCWAKIPRKLDGDCGRHAGGGR